MDECFFFFAVENNKKSLTNSQLFEAGVVSCCGRVLDHQHCRQNEACLWTSSKVLSPPGHRPARLAVPRGHLTGSGRWHSLLLGVARARSGRRSPSEILLVGHEARVWPPGGTEAELRVESSCIRIDHSLSPQPSSDSNEPSAAVRNQG